MRSHLLGTHHVCGSVQNYTDFSENYVADLMFDQCFDHDENHGDDEHRDGQQESSMEAETISIESAGTGEGNQSIVEESFVEAANPEMNHGPRKRREIVKGEGRKNRKKSVGKSSASATSVSGSKNRKKSAGASSASTASGMQTGEDTRYVFFSGSQRGRGQ